MSLGSKAIIIAWVTFFIVALYIANEYGAAKMGG